MSIAENLNRINAWLFEKGVSSDEMPPAADVDELSKLGSLYFNKSIGELSDFYSYQDGFPNWFIIYGAWQFLDLKAAFYDKDIIEKSSSHMQDGRWRAFWFPILTNNGGDYVFKNLESGEIEFYSHLDGEIILISENLEQFLRMLADDIDRNEYVFEDEEPYYRGRRIIGYG